MKISRIAMLLGAFSVVAVGGCASAKKSSGTATSGPTSAESGATGETYGPEETMGPFKTSDDDYGPTRPKVQTVALVLGPGMARGLAHAGVIQALHQGKIKVGAIYATEIGAWVGALYAAKLNLNQLEWGLQRIKENTFPPAGSRARVQNVLKEMFGAQHIQESKIPIAIGLAGDRKQVIDVENGLSADLLMAAVARDKTEIEPISILETSSEKFQTAAVVRTNVVGVARQRGVGKVVCVEVVRGHACDGADLRIAPVLGALRDDDFSRRAEIIFKGKKAAQDALPALSELLK